MVVLNKVIVKDKELSKMDGLQNVIMLRVKEVENWVWKRY